MKVSFATLKTCDKNTSTDCNSKNFDSNEPKVTHEPESNSIEEFENWLKKFAIKL